MKIDPDNLPYRPCAGMMLLNKAGRVFTAKRIDTVVEAWQMPQGGIDAGEDPEQAALRELEEEIGTNDVEVIARTEDWLYYDLPDHLLGKVWKGKYRGQKMKWFVFRFLGQDNDINIETDHPEFSEWQWLAMEELVEKIVPFKRPLYKELIKRFGALAKNQDHIKNAR